MNEESALSICTTAIVAGAVTVILAMSSCEKHGQEQDRMVKEAYIANGYMLEPKTPEKPERWVKCESKP